MRFRSEFFPTTVACIALALASLIGCKQSQPETSDTTSVIAKTETRTGSVIGSDQATSFKALLDTIRVRALRGDTVGLARLLVDDSVYRRNVYPVSPAYDSTRESVFTFVLGMHRTNNAKGLRRLLGDVSDKAHRGEITILEVTPTAQTPTREGILHEISEYSGKKPGIQLSGSILCHKQGCQVVSYAPAGAKGT
jgi:hypothetical protein